MVDVWPASGEEPRTRPPRPDSRRRGTGRSLARGRHDLGLAPRRGRFGPARFRLNSGAEGAQNDVQSSLHRAAGCAGVRVRPGRRSLMRPWVPSAALACLLTATEVDGQEFRATVTGQVTASSGAPLAGVKIVVTRRETNTSVEAVTNERGHYTVPFLTAGRYRIRAEATSFR